MKVERWKLKEKKKEKLRKRDKIIFYKDQTVIKEKESSMKKNWNNYKM